MDKETQKINHGRRITGDGLRTMVIILMLGLTLRLIVWQWREFYPLGGDEQEYLGQALTLLQERRYVELRLMRPPLYGVFLAVCIYFVDSLVQNLRLVQAVISTLTIIPVWLLTREIVAYESHRISRRSHAVVVLATLLCALSYTLAANATELLTETVFLFGLATFFWLLLNAGRRWAAHQQPNTIRHPGPSPPGQRHVVTIAAGLVLGALCLTRSVALPLLPLGALWLLLATRQWPTGDGQRAMPIRTAWRTLIRGPWSAVVIFALATLLVILPWSVRNYATYGGFILVDTTGAENLWLDNDPAGREAVKAQLYAMEEDRLARQQLATQRGIAVITADPGRFATKAWGELQYFFALEYIDDMRARPVIWVPPAEVWARLILGDGLWLVLLLAGTVGLTRSILLDGWGSHGGLPQPASPGDHQLGRHGGPHQSRPPWRPQPPIPNPRLPSPAWLFLAWALYVILTGMVFHVELRYRLPLYPVLLPYAALALMGQMHNVEQRKAKRAVRLITVGSLLPAALCVTLLLLHRPYPTVLWQLGWKHAHLARAERALTHGDTTAAQAAAQAALEHDPESVLAQVALAHAEIQTGQPEAAETTLHTAIDTLPDHPQPHLLLGDLLRRQGEPAAAQRELRYYETASLQDLQTWSWRWFTTPPPSSLDIGGGLDLGFVRGFYAADVDTDWRWTTDLVHIRLATAEPQPILHLRLAAGRPTDAPLPEVEVWARGQFVGRFAVTPGWHDYILPLPSADDEPQAVASAGQPAGGDDQESVIIELRSDTFTPRDYDQTSNDGRTLGVMVDWVELTSNDE